MLENVLDSGLNDLQFALRFSWEFLTLSNLGLVVRQVDSVAMTRLQTLRGALFCPPAHHSGWGNAAPALTGKEVGLLGFFDAHLK